MKRWILALVMLGLSVVPALAETAVTTGMGYKKMLSELCALYKQESGKQLTEVYSGTIGQSLAQYKAGSGVSVFVSDRQTLEDSDVSFASFQPLGTAVLVLAWKKGLNGIAAGPPKSENPVHRLSRQEGAIYGRPLSDSRTAAWTSEGLRMFSTVPGVFPSTTGELDAGFVNTAVVKAGASPSGSMTSVRLRSYRNGRGGGQRRRRTPKSRRFCVPQSDKADPFTPSTGCVHNRNRRSANCCTTEVLFCVAYLEGCRRVSGLHLITAVPLALRARSPKAPFRRTLNFVVTLPLVFPPIALGYLLLMALGQTGLGSTPAAVRGQLIFRRRSLAAYIAAASGQTCQAASQ
ncbi:MAG: hypothetical protein ACLSTO_10445 [Bilophila wadsworthia]